MSGAISNSDEYVIDDPEILAKIKEYVDWENLPGRHFIKRIEQGRLGKNIGIDNGLTDINKYIRGTQKARYYLIGADSGKQRVYGKY